MRRKVGGWVNLSHFYSLISEKKHEALDQEIENILPHHKRQQKSTPERFYGIWTTLENARAFAKKHGIYNALAPLLAFDRVALVNYMGYQYFEYFVCPTVDIAIRILRDTSKYIERVNMDQVFIAYKKYKGNANLQLQRSFYTYYKDIFKRGESTLLGGHWTDREAAAKFTRKHGFYQILKPILAFPFNDPSQQDPYPIDIVQANIMQYWKATSCDDSFYGFPETFKGGLAPKRPSKERRNRVFRFTDLTVEKRFSIETTKGDDAFKRNLTLLRRLSDGAVNATMLISICVLLKSNDLNLGADDPDFLIHNELYQRDKLENVPCETVTTHSSKYLNGKWCSAKDARFLFAQFNLVKKDKETEAKEVDGLSQFLNDERFKSVEDQDEDEVLESNGVKPKQEEDDEFVMIPENDFRKAQNDAKKEAIYYDSKFFENANSSDEEELEAADFNDMEDAQGKVGEDVEEILDDDDEDFVAVKGSRPKRRRFSLANSSDVEGGSVNPKKRKTGGVFISEEEEDDDDGDGDDDFKEDADIEDETNSLFVDSQEGKEPQPDIDERLDELKRKEQTETVILALKALVANFDNNFKKNQKSFRIQKEFDGYFQDLQKFRAISTEIKIRSNLTQTLKKIKNFANNYNRKTEELERNWIDQERNGELPSKDQVIKLSGANPYAKLSANKNNNPNHNNFINHQANGGANAFSRVHRTISPSHPQPPPPQPTWNQAPVGPNPHQYAPFQQQRNYNNFNNGVQQQQFPKQPVIPRYNPQPVPSQPHVQRHYPGNVPYGANNRQFGRPVPPPGQPHVQQQQQAPPPPVVPPAQRPSPTIRQAQISSPTFPAAQLQRSGGSSPNPYIVNPPNGPSSLGKKNSPIQPPPPPPRVGVSPKTAQQPPIQPIARRAPQSSEGYVRSSSTTSGGSSSTGNEKFQNKYRERPTELKDSYVPSAYPNGARRSGATPSTSSSSASPRRVVVVPVSKSPINKNAPRIEYKIDKPLSPPSNFIQMNGEGLDYEDMDIGDYEDMLKSKQDEDEVTQQQNDPLEKYRRIVHFETRTKQDLFKRAKVFFQDDPRVGFSERLHAMMLEGYERRHGIKLNIKKK